MNQNYRRGRQKEYSLKDSLEKDGYIVFRTAGSHGIADLIAVRPRLEGKADLFPEVRFIQVKSGTKILEEKREIQHHAHLQIEFFFFPTKTKEWYAERNRKRIGGKKTRTG